MIIEIREENLGSIRNSRLRRHAGQYIEIQRRFYEQVETFGLAFDRENGPEQERETAALYEQLSSLETAAFFNGRRSVCLGHKSTACRACAKGIGTATLFLSLQCGRNCYFCFNPNQDNYEYYRLHKNNWQRELGQIAASGEKMTHLALTGGEPLLYPDDTVNFFRLARELFPDVHTRLYTAGDLLTVSVLKELEQAGLNEIRFSVKLEDSDGERRRLLEKIALAGDYIPDVMVEMPVIPGTLEEMKELLTALDRLNIRGINLLEFCFPLHNAEEFARRGFRIKYPPHPVLYNFWYAGGLPIARSEIEALKLLLFSAGQKLRLGVHYCSLANKHLGQIYRQNTAGNDTDPTLLFSEKDFYLKTARVFGSDTMQVKNILEKNGVSDYRYEKEYRFLQFHPRHIPLLEAMNPEIGISCCVREYRGGEFVLRELKCDCTTAKIFDIQDL